MVLHLRGASNETTEVVIGRIITRYSQDQRPEYPIRKIIVGSE